MADYVIVGGGIYGCTVAWELAKRGAEVQLLEAKTVASGASGGLGERGVRANGRDRRELPLMRLAYDIWTHLHEQIGGDTGYRRLGHLDLIEREEDLARAPAQVWLQNQQGIESYLLDAAELRELEPKVSENVIAAVYCPKDGVADHTATTRAMANAAQREGALILENAKVTGMARQGQRVVALEALIAGEPVEIPVGKQVISALERACGGLRRRAPGLAVADLADAATGDGAGSANPAADDAAHRSCPSHAGDQAAAGRASDGLRRLARTLGRDDWARRTGCRAGRGQSAGGGRGVSGAGGSGGRRGVYRSRRDGVCGRDTDHRHAARRGQHAGGRGLVGAWLGDCAGGGEADGGVGVGWGAVGGVQSVLLLTI